MTKADINRRWAASYEKAAMAMRQADIDAVCSRCGAEKSGNSLRVRYFHTLYEIKLPELEFTPPDLSQAQQILILHYLTSDMKPDAGSSNPAGDYLSFRNLPGGMFYDYAYQKNGPHRILAAFGEKPGLLVEAAQKLGGEKAVYGDTAARVPIFPMFDAIVVLHRGDEEFPPDVNILFRDTITAFLPLEDVAVLAGYLAGNLQKALK